MSQPLKKQPIIAIFGQKAGTKLYNFLNDCCASIETRIEITCEEPGVSYRVKQYIKSSLPLHNQLFLMAIGDSVNSIGVVAMGNFSSFFIVTAAGGEEVLVKDTLVSVAVLDSGVTYSYIVVGVGNGLKSEIGLVTTPIC